MRFAFLLAICVLVRGDPPVIEQLTGQFGDFSTPNHPRPYDDNLELHWGIKVREGYHIKLRFTSFDLEDSYEVGRGPCIYDYVKITEGDKDIERFCGRKMPFYYDAPTPHQWIVSQGNVLNITFVSDYSNEGITPTGFEAHFVEEDIDECRLMKIKEQTTVEDWDELVTCNHYCNNVPASYYCSCRAGFQLHSNQHTCVAKFCEDRDLTDDQGVIESPDYPNPYAKLSHCTWNVLVRDGLSLHFIFDEEFGVEKHAEDGCVYDILSLEYKGKTETPCGNEAPFNGTVEDMNTRNVIVKFDTDLSVEMKGFRINYNTSRIKCLTKLDDPTNGKISSNKTKEHYEFEDVVNYTCNRGYDLIGNSELSCLSDGTWDHKEPTCKIKSCGIPDELLAVKYSSIVDYVTKNFTYLEVLTVKCDEWYELREGVAEWRCEDSKQWVRNDNNTNRRIPVCRPKCGSRHVKENVEEGQLAGGKFVTKEGGWPWMAFIDFGKRRGGDDFCGGTLVDEMTVVTAAHCLNNLDKGETVDVWLGVNNRKTDNMNYTQKFVVPESMTESHSDYDPAIGSNFDNDIATLKLDKPVTFSRYVHPICVPQSPAEKNLPETFRRNRKKVVITGWGVTAQGNVSEILQKVRMPVVDLEQCRLSYEAKFGEPGWITKNMLCAGTPLGKNDACKGDSGGPLMTYAGDEFKKWYLSGIVSFGDERRTDSCGQPGPYGVYTNTAMYDEFLAEKMG